MSQNVFFIFQMNSLSYKIFWRGYQDEEDLLRRCAKVVCGSVQRRIWHREPFNLQKAPEGQDHVLEGRLHFGEDVNDEWFAIGLLLRISAQIKDVVIKLEDEDDGDILLIEAADDIPNWAQEPDLADMRTYLRHGRVHLIPYNPTTPALLTPLPNCLPDLKSAVDVVAKYSRITEASKDVQKVIVDRVEKSSLESTNHFIHVFIPEKAAKLLRHSPRLVSAFVHSFLELNGHEARECRPEDSDVLVKSGVEMTKCLYAMLSSKTLYPNRKSSWQFPPDQRHPDFKANADGFKLAVGLNAMMKCLQSNLRSGSEDSLDLFLNHSKLQGDDHGLADLEEALGACENDDAPISPPLKEADSDSWMNFNAEEFDRLLQKHFGETNDSRIVDSLEMFLNRESDLKGVEEDCDTPDEDCGTEEVQFKVDKFQDAFESLFERLSSAKIDAEMEDELKAANLTLEDGSADVVNALNAAAGADGPMKTFLSSINK